ncbi:GTP-binding protein SAR1B-like [Quercus robur]|uniref:GTP-binding protein SAR1B-like n=1 Tax=Quercus robur TaxID=38942 RepID=UPI002162D1D5|nr:GTP-binding protein SAR1B-like [Quercus robur]
MSLLSWVLAVLNWLSNFLINQHGGFNPFRPKEVNILLLCQDMACQAQMVLLFGDEWASMNSWVSIIGNIKYKFFCIGGPQIARRVWRDYGKMDAVVYIVNADAIIRGRTEELNAELREQFAGPREDLIDLRSDEAFAEAPFLIFGVTFLEAFLNPREKLRYFLELPSGEASVTKELADANDRPLEVFWAKAGNKMQYLDGFKWLSQYI